MQIIKRNGTTESYDREKIAVAIRKSFISTQKEITDEAVYTIVDEVEQFLHQNEANRSVERIQDEVERSLMEHGFYAEAKNYILYRWQRTERRKVLSQIITGTGDDTIANILKKIKKEKRRLLNTVVSFFHLSGDIFVTETSNRCNTNERPAEGRCK